MSKCPRCLAALTFFLLLSIAASAQTTISGVIRNSVTKEPVPYVSIVVKGTGAGTITDDKGNFKLTTNHSFPLTLALTSTGFISQDVTVNSADAAVEVNLLPGSSLDEVVISASRVPERILESPVSIERMSSANIRASAAPNYYDGVANLKGVDLTTSSLTFRTISTRGFNGSGNLRFNQLVDGMDNQAPGLNFSVGNIIGMTELDVDNVELLQGASSALYGSGGMNGTLLMTSKDPFKYQGLSVQAKVGAMHFGDNNVKDPTLYHDYTLRYAKKVSDKFAFKISGQFVKADDWRAADTRNLNRNNVLSNLKDGDRASDPNYDGVNVFGDEASASMGAFAQAYQAQTRAGILSATGNMVDIVNDMNTKLPNQPTQAQVASFVGSYPAALQSSVANLVPFNLGLRNSVFGGQSVSRTGYDEKDLVNYNTYNVKVSGGLYYKISENVEASLQAYWGTGTTVYTGADRYSLKNLRMGQYKAEIKAKNWFLRAYTIQENSGDSYTATTAAVAINSKWKDNSTWFGQYTGTYSGYRLQGATDAAAHVAARTTADAGRLLPGTPEYNAAFNEAINKSIKDGGAKFADASDMYHVEGQYNLTDVVKFAELLVGANVRVYSLNSHGTIFADTAGRINITEFGGYAQLQKWVIAERLKLTVSGRYDKNENFNGRFTPRATALVKLSKDNSVRFSFQQAYRFPSTQDQWINLKTPASILIGGLPDFYNFFQFGTAPAYTAESIVAYRASVNSGAANPGLLQVADFGKLKPEIANSYEIGYRGLPVSNLLIDGYAYYSEYKNFIGRKASGRGQSASTSAAVSYQELASPFTTTNYSFVSNASSTVKALGWGISVSYRFPMGYELGANFSGDQLRHVDSGFVTFFNTPNFRYNITFGNQKIGKTNWGFNFLYRWQNKMLWEGTFGTGDVPSFGTLDGQISYRLPKIKSLIKVGATNLLNKYYTSAFGNPSVGGLYYVSIGYNVF